MRSKVLDSLVWNATFLRRQARELSALAAREMTRRDTVIRVSNCAARVEKLLRSRVTPETVSRLVAEIAAVSLHLANPRYVAQQVAAPVPLAALVESVVAALNNSLAVWEMSPAGTAIEHDLMGLFKRAFGYPASAQASSVPGGAFANLTALLAARAKLEPDSWNRGGARIALLAGAQAHYSLSRAAGIMGLGSRSVFVVPVDGLYRTNTSELGSAFRRARNAGFRKFVVVATCGSTPTGSCDDLKQLAKMAREEGAWLHVDASHGGGIVFSPRYRFLLDGIESADSIAFDPHKLLFMPLTASVVLVRDGQFLRAAFEQDAPYLFSAAPRELPDLGQFTIACSQRFDALKTWLTWKAYSEKLWDELITRVCNVTRAAYEYCMRSRLIEALHEPQLNVLCFRLRTRPRSAGASDSLHWRIKERVNAGGKAYISSTVLDGRRVLRIVVMNPRTRERDIRDVMAEVERVGMLELKSARSS
jgi:L-2,4-diaminobutyrate decarboxylase